nr:hypothetical protein [uncultured Roseibium sp.]
MLRNDLTVAGDTVSVGVVNLFNLVAVGEATSQSTLPNGITHTVPRLGGRLFEIVLRDRGPDAKFQRVDLAGLAGMQLDAVMRQGLEDMVRVFAVARQPVRCRADGDMDVTAFGAFQELVNSRALLEIRTRRRIVGKHIADSPTLPLRIFLACADLRFDGLFVLFFVGIPGIDDGCLGHASEVLLGFL